MAACRGGDTLVVTKLDRLARSLPDARDIAGEHTQAELAELFRVSRTTVYRELQRRSA